MRIHLLIIFSLCILFKSNAQNDTLTKTNDTKVSQVYVFVEKMPVFINGGDEGFNKFIKKNIVIPAGPKPTGTVFIEYIIDIDGSVTDVKVVPGRGLSKAYDQACIDVISKSPKWTPAVQNGQPKRLKKITKINF